MKLPSSVRIMGRWINIVYEDVIESDDGILLGYYDDNKRCIHIKKGQTKEETYRTIVHEICHGFLRASGLYEIIGDKAEEAICRLFENFCEYTTWDYKSDAIKYSNKQKR